MTGFGRGTAEQDGQALTVELKSVNHRFLDLSFRMPQALWALEGTLRGLLSDSLGRGHVDITVRHEVVGGEAAGVVVNLPLARAYAQAWQQLQQHTGLKRKPGLRELAAIPGVVTQQDAPDDQGQLEQLLRQATQQALAQLVAARLQEGQALLAQLQACHRNLGDLLTRMAQLAGQQPRLCKERLEQRILELCQDGVDPQRLAQEVALQAERCAVDEELTRMRAHLEQLDSLLNDQGPVGRKLDFLLQEMHREVNTIGSKSADIGLTQLVLAAKSELETLREQVQNIE